MIIIQEITVVWNKNERGGENSRARKNYIFKMPIEKIPSKSDQCLYDKHRLYQRDKKFYTPSEYYKLLGQKIRFYGKREYEPPVLISQLKVKNVSLDESEGGVEVSFSYDPQINGSPSRKGHNKDYDNTHSRFYGKDILNETAFVLKEGQKGQIMYNGRFSDYDTGQWWYEQTAVNIAVVSFEKYSKGVFLSSEVDFYYKQLAHLN